MKKFLQNIHSAQGASTLQTIALTAIVLIFITGALTVVWNRGDEFDTAVDRVGDNNISLWRGAGNIPPQVTGPTYEVNFGGGGSGSGGSGSGGTAENAGQGDGVATIVEEECEKGFVDGFVDGVADFLTGIWELLTLLWEVIFDFDTAKKKLGAIADQLKVLGDSLWSFVKNVWWDREAALEDLKNALKSIFPDIADALDRGCYGEASGRITVEVLTSVASFTKPAKLLKLIDKLSPTELLKFFKSISHKDLLKMADGLTPSERKALRDKLVVAGTPCRILSLLGPNSFAANTEVLTPLGLIAISKINVGDLVFAYHEENGSVGIYPVTNTIVHLDPVLVLLVVDGELIETTPEHPFYAMVESPSLIEGQRIGQWVEAQNLTIGTHLQKFDGTSGTIDSVEIVEVEQWMYNLTVADAHTFFVGHGHWLVHNSGPCDLISAKRRKHILEGDETGGGHLWPGKPNKPNNSVFPKSWDGDKVITELADIVTDPDTKWYAQTGNGGLYTKKGDPARWVAWETRDGVRIRVVYEPATGEVITGFPDSSPPKGIAIP